MERWAPGSVPLGLHTDPTAMHLQYRYYGIRADASLIASFLGMSGKWCGPRTSHYQHLFDVFFKHCLVSSTMTGFSSLKDLEQQQLYLDRQQNFTNSC